MLSLLRSLRHSSSHPLTFVFSIVLVAVLATFTSAAIVGVDFGSEFIKVSETHTTISEEEALQTQSIYQSMPLYCSWRMHAGSSCVTCSFQSCPAPSVTTEHYRFSFLPMLTFLLSCELPLLPSSFHCCFLFVSL